MEKQKGGAEILPKLHNEKKCRGCGKTVFITPQWVYRIAYDRGILWFCSYSCKRRYEEAKEAKKAEKRKYTRIKKGGGTV